MGAKQFKIRLDGFAEECDDPTEAIVESLGDAPGIDGIPARVLSAMVVEDDVVGVIEADPRDYVRQCIAYDQEPLDVLGRLKADGMSATDLAELVEWLRSDPDLKVAVIQTEDGKFAVDEYPTKANI